MEPARRAVVSFSLHRFRKLRRLSVCNNFVYHRSFLNMDVLAKFQHYMYGGRPLGTSSCFSLL